MALPSSGAISLNQIHTGAGGASGDLANLNDTDIRALIGKASEAEMSFSEFYFTLANNIYSVYRTTNYIGGLGYVYFRTDGSADTYPGGTGSWGTPIHASVGNDYDVKFTYSLPNGWTKSASTPSSGSWVRLDATRGVSVNNNITYDNETTMSVSYAIRKHGTTTTLFTGSFDITLIYENE